MKKLLLLVGLLVVCSSSARAAVLKPDDFAYGIRIDVPRATAVAAFSLPEQVYAHTYRADLGDMRVFNVDGEPVPHLIRYARTRPEEVSWEQLAFFPLPEKVRPEEGGYRVFVRTRPDGAIVRVDPQAAPAASQPARTFLIDLSRANRRLAQLRLAWLPGNTHLLAAFAVDGSDDLIHWTTLQPRAALADIRDGGHHLFNDTISLTPSPQRYLRLRQLDTGPGVALARIDGRFNPPGRAPIRAFVKLDGRPVPDAPGVFEYRTPGAFPVDRVNLVFSQANSMADATLESRDDSQAAWTRRFKGLFYRIDVDRSPLTSAPQPVALNTDRHWRLTVNASDSTIGTAIPQLEFGYRPHDLFFIARGSGPFTLAFGSATAEPLQANVAALFSGISRQQENGVERWVTPPSERVVLGGPERLSPSPKPLPMRRIILWSVLLAGVLVIAAMAWRLASKLMS